MPSLQHRAQAYTAGAPVRRLVLVFVFAAALVVVSGQGVFGTGSGAEAGNFSIAGQTGGSTDAIALVGDHVYVGVGPRLVILNVSDPATPTVVAQSQLLPELVQDLTVAEGYAYVLEGSRMHVFDVSDASAPRDVGRFAPGMALSRVVVVGKRAYVVAPYNGLLILDVTNPARHVQIGRYIPVDGHIVDVAVRGDRAYLAEYRMHDPATATSGGLRIVDVADAAAPAELGSYSTRYGALDVAVANGYAYLATGEGGLRIIRVTYPRFPVEAGAYGEDDGSAVVDARGVKISGQRVYLFRPGALQLLDITRPTEPRELGLYQSLAEPRAVAVAGDLAFLASGLGGLRILDVQNPSAQVSGGVQPFTGTVQYVEIGAYRPLGNVQDVSLEGNSAYVADGANGLRALRIKHSARPELLDSRPGFAVDLVVESGYAYVTGEDFRIFDVRDPAAMRLAGALEITETYDLPAIAIQGHYAYLAQEPYGLRVIGITDPVSPRQVATHDVPEYGVSTVAVAGEYAFLASRSGLYIFDVSNPRAPILLHFYPIQHVFDVAVKENLVYLVTGGDCFRGHCTGAGLYILDVTDPAEPFQRGYYERGGEAVTVAGDYAFMADGRSGLLIVDISDPAVPRQVASFDTPGLALDVDVDSNRIGVADGAGGLVIVRYNDPDGPPLGMPTPTVTSTSTPSPTATVPATATSTVTQTPAPTTATATPSSTSTAIATPRAGSLYLPLVYRAR